MAKTSIEWTDHSINPLRARLQNTSKVGHYCEKISPGCDHCYSSAYQVRRGLPTFGSGQHRGEVDLFLDKSKLREVLKRNTPTRYFWCDMTDLFGEWVPDEWIALCFAAMESTPRHTHQVLTKRADRMQKLLSHEDFPMLVRKMGYDHFGGSTYREQGPHWRNNQWLGVSVEDQQRADERIPLLLQTPAAVRFLSVEPLLGPVDLDEWFKRYYPAKHKTHGNIIDWVIVGGESGPHARPMHPDWARSIRDQCVAAGVRFFFKQWGDWLPFATEAHYDDGNVGGDCGGPNALTFRDHLCGEPRRMHRVPMGKCCASMPNGSHLLVRYVEPAGHEWGRENRCSQTYVRVGKAAAGRLLDGREWNEFPEVARA